VFTYRNKDTDEIVALKAIEKQSLTMKEKEFLKEEI
jgi:hypothetical protein